MKCYKWNISILTKNIIYLLTINIRSIKQIHMKVMMLRHFYNNITIFNNIQKDFWRF